MAIRLLTGDVRAMLATLEDASVQCVVTSPPYFGLRSYGSEPQIWGSDDPDCAHNWQTDRRYVEGGGGLSSAEAFSEPGQANADRLKSARWKQDDTCRSCGAWRGELGQERTLSDFVAHLVEVFQAVKRVLRPDGVCFVNLGDSYNAGRDGGHPGGKAQWKDDRYPNRSGANVPGLKAKDLMMAPARFAIAMCDDGWYLRSDIIWHKPNPMPESCTDRPSSAHEHIFLLTKSARYFYDAAAVRTEAKAPTTKMPDGWDTGPGAHGSFHRNGREQGERVDKQRGHGRRHDGFNDRWDAMPRDEQMAMGANLRNVWTVATHAWPKAHFATFPPEIPRRCILAGTSEKGCCSSCGAPWVRVVDRTFVQTDSPGVTKGGRKGMDASNGWGDVPRGRIDAETTGWKASCQCDAGPPIPCTVLDPFAGAGTTGLVADRLGRDAVLIELNPSYSDMIKDRITGDAPLFAQIEVA